MHANLEFPRFNLCLLSYYTGLSKSIGRYGKNCLIQSFFQTILVSFSPEKCGICNNKIKLLFLSTLGDLFVNATCCNIL